MGLRNDRLQRLKDAIAAWKQKIQDERAAAEATARAEREAAEAAREAAAKQKATTEVTTYLNELHQLYLDVDTLVTDTLTQQVIVNTAATDAAADDNSDDAIVERDAAINASAIITRKVNDIAVKKAALELAFYNIKKSADDYDDLATDLANGTSYYNDAIVLIDSVADSKKNAESKVSYIVGRVSTLLAEEAAAAAEAARLAAIQAAEDARIADELLKATAAVSMYLTQVQDLAADIDTTVASLDTASATIGTNKTDAGNATVSADAITARDNIAVQSANITVLVNTLGQKAAALETAYGNLVTAAGTHATLQDELATGTTEYNDAQTAIQSVSTAKKDAESHLAYAQNAASTLLASEAAAQAAADAAAAQEAAELEAARVAAEAEAAAIAAAEAKKTEAMTYTDNAISGLIDSAPGTLDTLNELAAALGDDPNFAATVTNQLALLDNGKVGVIDIVGKTVGSATKIPVITYNNQGQITSATETNITVGNGAMSVTAGAGLSGGGQVGTANQTGSSSVTISHADTSSVTNIDTSGKVVIDALTFDTYGHVTGATSRTLDFYTTGEANGRYLRRDTLDTHTYNTTTGEALRFANNTSGGKIQLGFQQKDTDGMHHRAYFKAYKSPSANVAGVFEIQTRGVNGAANDIFKLETGQHPKWNDNKMFHDGYHPNADKWTTARTNTVTLTGDATGSGSASVDGSGNWTVSVPVTVANDSHTHDGRYVNVAGDTMTGDLTMSGSDIHLDGVGQRITFGQTPGTVGYIRQSVAGQLEIGSDDQIGFYETDANVAAVQISTNNKTVTAPGGFIGNASSATHAGRWTTARNNNINLTGDVTGYGSASVDGSGNWTVTVNTTVGNNSHNHTSLTGVTSIGFATDASDSASISTTISGANTYFDFNLSDDNSQDDQWRWRFTPSGSTVYNAMVLDPVSNGNANLTVSGTVTADSFSGNASSATHAGRWTTARTNTVTLTGDATGSGSASVDGSGNWTVTVNTTVGNDSHTHDGRYYTETESDSRFVNVTGDTMTGRLIPDTSSDYKQTAVTSLTNAPIYYPEVNVGSADTYLPAFHMRALHSGGYRTHMNVGLHKDSSGWGNNSTGLYVALGGNDGYPTENYKLTYGGEINHSVAGRFFADNYHPNADKWTTARTNTVTLTGDVTGSGSASVDGTGNWTVSLATTTAEADLMKYRGSITTQDWNTFIDGTEAGYYKVANMTGANKPPTYTYGTQVNWSTSGSNKLQLYGPHNGTDGKGIWIRTGWNTDYDAWREIALYGQNPYSGSNLRASVFYDSNDTAYYGDFASTSLLNRLELNGDLDFRGQTGTWVQSDQMADSMGWNTSHGVYIGSDTSGSNTYVYGDGTFYDGSTNRTLIHSGNVGSQSVSYATSAGTANQIDGIGFRNTNSNSGTNADTIDSNGITYYNAGVSNFSGNATDGALYSQRYSSSWQHQIAGDYRSGSIAVRGRNNGTWQGWLNVIDTGSQNVAKSGYIQSNNSLRAPIFYDSNNTGYYLDPASTSNIVAMRMKGNLSFDNYGLGPIGYYSSTRLQNVFAMDDQYKISDDGTSVGNHYGIVWSHSNAGTLGGANNMAGHGMIILTAGVYDGSWSEGRLDTTSQVRAPIYYDRNNTAYYGDFASTSKMNALQVNSLTVGGVAVTGGGVSYFEQTSAPSGGNGTMWLNTATGKTYQRQRGVWVQIAPGVGGMAVYDVNGTKVN